MCLFHKQTREQITPEKKLRIWFKKDGTRTFQTIFLLLLEQNRTRFESIVGKTPTKVIFTLWEHEGQISNEELATEIGKSDSTVEKSKRKIRQAEDQISLLVGDIF